MGGDNIDFNKLETLKFELIEALKESQKREKNILSMLPSWAQLIIGILLIIIPTVGSWYNMRLSIENLNNIILNMNRKIETLEIRSDSYSDFKISVTKDLNFTNVNLDNIRNDMQRLQSDIGVLKLKVNTLEKSR